MANVKHSFLKKSLLSSLIAVSLFSNTADASLNIVLDIFKVQSEAFSKVTGDVNKKLKEVYTPNFYKEFHSPDYGNSLHSLTTDANEEAETAFKFTSGFTSFTGNASKNADTINKTLKVITTDKPDFSTISKSVDTLQNAWDVKKNLKGIYNNLNTKQVPQTSKLLKVFTKNLTAFTKLNNNDYSNEEEIIESYKKLRRSAVALSDKTDTKDVLKYVDAMGDVLYMTDYSKKDNRNIVSLSGSLLLNTIIEEEVARDEILANKGTNYLKVLLQEYYIEQNGLAPQTEEEAKNIDVYVTDGCSILSGCKVKKVKWADVYLYKGEDEEINRNLETEYGDNQHSKYKVYLKNKELQEEERIKAEERKQKQKEFNEKLDKGKEYITDYFQDKGDTIEKVANEVINKAPKVLDHLAKEGKKKRDEELKQKQPSDKAKAKIEKIKKNKLPSNKVKAKKKEPIAKTDTTVSKKPKETKKPTTPKIPPKPTPPKKANTTKPPKKQPKPKTQPTYDFSKMKKSELIRHCSTNLSACDMALEKLNDDYKNNYDKIKEYATMDKLPVSKKTIIKSNGKRWNKNALADLRDIKSVLNLVKDNHNKNYASKEKLSIKEVNLKRQYSRLIILLNKTEAEIQKAKAEKAKSQTSAKSESVAPSKSRGKTLPPKKTNTTSKPKQPTDDFSKMSNTALLGKCSSNLSACDEALKRLNKDYITNAMKINNHIKKVANNNLSTPQKKAIKHNSALWKKNALSDLITMKEVLNLVENNHNKNYADKEKLSIKQANLNIQYNKLVALLNKSEEAKKKTETPPPKKAEEKKVKWGGYYATDTRTIEVKDKPVKNGKIPMFGKERTLKYDNYNYVGWGSWKARNKHDVSLDRKFVYGKQTIALPRTGKANYSGDAMGDLVSLYKKTGKTYLYEVKGDVSLRADFNKNKISGKLVLIPVSNPERYGTFIFKPTPINNSSFKTSNINVRVDERNTYSLRNNSNIQGSFYGDKAQEIGGAFNINQGDRLYKKSVTGIFRAKQQK